MSATNGRVPPVGEDSKVGAAGGISSNDKTLPEQSGANNQSAKTGGNDQDQQDNTPRNRGAVHQTRDQDSRDPMHGWDEDRPWTPPSNLAAPEARPGMAQRWIRVSIRSEDDPSNVARSFQEGWKPRQASTVPNDFAAPTISHGRFAGYIGVHGLILCEMPAKRLAQRDAYYRDITDRQTQAVGTDLAKDSDPRMPIEQVRRSGVIHGTRRPEVQEDAA